MTLEDILALDLTLHMKIWSIKILIGKALNRAHRLRTPSGMLCIRSQRPVIWSNTEYALRRKEYAQRTRLGRLGRVISAGLTRLGVDLTSDR